MRYRFVGHKLRWAVLGPWMFSGYNSEPLAAFGAIQGRQSGMEAFRRSQAHKKPGALRLLNWFSLGFRADSTF